MPGKNNHLIYEAVLGFSQEEALAIVAGGVEKGGTLYQIYTVPEKKVSAGAGYTPVKQDSGYERGLVYEEYLVGEYRVKLQVASPDEVRASCECMDFVIRGRNQKAACKHIAAALDYQDEEVLKHLTRR
jgi:hypothetical protein